MTIPRKWCIPTGSRGSLQGDTVWHVCTSCVTTQADRLPTCVVLGFCAGACVCHAQGVPPRGEDCGLQRAAGEYSASVHAQGLETSALYSTKQPYVIQLCVPCPCAVQQLLGAFGRSAGDVCEVMGREKGRAQASSPRMFRVHAAAGVGAPCFSVWPAIRVGYWVHAVCNVIASWWLVRGPSLPKMVVMSGFICIKMGTQFVCAGSEVLDRHASRWKKVGAGQSAAGPRATCCSASW